jgi:hypothetical protein
MSGFVKPASDEATDWVGVRRNPANEWRCQHLRPNGRKCNRLLAVGEPDGMLYSRRRDHHVKFIDFGGSAAGIRCTECERWNWLLSELLTEEQIERLKTEINK